MAPFYIRVYNKLSYRRKSAHLITSLYRTVQKHFGMLNRLEACASVIINVELSLNINLIEGCEPA